jgi:uncharacterized membrane protein
MNGDTPSRSEAQHQADRIRALRHDLAHLERENILTLTPHQKATLDLWSTQTLARLAARFDIDTSDSQRRLSWGLRIASTLGGFALCAALVLFFLHFWGFLDTPIQIACATALPLAALAATEFAARREHTLYFAGLLALIALGAFILNLSVLGRVFNITPTEGALLAWGLFSLLLAYRYGLRLLLIAALGLLLCWGSAALIARSGFYWLNFGERPEHFLVMGVITFAVPLAIPHRRHTDFPAVYRLAGIFSFLASVLLLSASGNSSYFPLDTKTIERAYETLGIFSSAAFIALGIRRQWDGAVNLSAAFFVVFLYVRLFHWWWDWMPRYLFFAIIGAIAIALVLAFKRVRTHLKQENPA